MCVTDGSESRATVYERRVLCMLQARTAIMFNSTLLTRCHDRDSDVKILKSLGSNGEDLECQGKWWDGFNVFGYRITEHYYAGGVVPSLVHLRRRSPPC